ncbi:MAG TPA: isoprenylcysteine carboxylmethyltransferase family protein [Bacteroidales bacterium]|nr:isoprenylcysteine carboxylmethyltransferase family protein [Bacteroidales bacterium]
MKIKAQAYLFVIVQFAMLALLLATGPWVSPSPVGLIVELAGLLVGITAILHMQIGNFGVAPLPKQGSRLVTTGIYSMIRHPMYLAQLMVMLPLVVDHYSLFRLAAWSVLLVNLIFKQLFEEKQLIKQFADYRDYMNNSWRMVPFIF